MLENLRLEYLENKILYETGIDSYNQCLDQKHFKNYPYQISYYYNERGFRDTKWPNDLLDDCVWCVGDSFTVGLGSPIERTWVKCLQDKIDKRTINISMDGASNHWIAKCVKKISTEIKPKNIVIMWSYLHRREFNAQNMPDNLKRLRFVKYETIEDDLMHFNWCTNLVEKYKGNTNLIHLIIPKPVSEEHKNKLSFNLSNFIGEVPLLDYARDKHHFDKVTSDWVVEQVVPLLTK